MLRWILGAGYLSTLLFVTLNSNLTNTELFSFVFESFDAEPELMLLSMSISLGGGFGSSRDPSEEDAIVDRISLIFLLLVACDLFSLILSFRNRIVISN